MKTLTNNPNQQYGATLVVSLVMLVVLTLLVISAMRSSNTNLRIAGNMQFQAETIAAAQQATEAKISTDFWTAPVASNVIVTIGLAQYTAAISAPECTGSAPLLSSDPTFTEACRIGGTIKDSLPDYESAPAAVEPTLCLKQQWDVQTSVSDTSTGANTTLHQGVSLNVKKTVGC